MLYTCIAGVAFLSWYVLWLCCPWVRSVIMYYSHVFLFNFRYSPYHYTSDFGFSTHDSDSKKVFVSCHYICLFSSSHALKNTFILFPCFYCINLCAICFTWYEYNLMDFLHFMFFSSSNALVEFVFVGSDNAFRPPHQIIWGIILCLHVRYVFTIV